MCSRPKSTADIKIISRVRQLTKKYHNVRINLPREDGSMEGLWAVPIDDEAEEKVQDDNSNGDIITMVLVNQPLGGWHGKNWGDDIKVRTRGLECPVGVLS